MYFKVLQNVATLTLTPNLAIHSCCISWRYIPGKVKPECSNRNAKTLKSSVSYSRTACPNTLRKAAVIVDDQSQQEYLLKFT
jgi:hypothetical protein